ncbi:hypothetical protein NXS19_014264 [Fusarium pseudograminearum]|nr:hypothetical protein NXS19_014264 [Fusarium pseudograminearum]
MHLNHTAALQDFWGFKCARATLVPMELGNALARLFDIIHQYVPSLPVILEPISTLPPSPFAISYHHKTFSRNTALIGPGAMAAICIAVLFAVVICLGIIARYFKRSSVKSMHKNPTYLPIISQAAVDKIESPNAASIQTVNDSDSPHLASDCRPINVTQSKMTFLSGGRGILC